MYRFGLVHYCRWRQGFLPWRRSPKRRVSAAAARRTIRTKLGVRFEWLLSTTLTFGKYKGTPWLLIPDDYIEWAIKQFSMTDIGMFVVLKQLRSQLRQAFPQHATWVWDACPHAMQVAQASYCIRQRSCIIDKRPFLDS